jgi:hypothetical protein
MYVVAAILDVTRDLFKYGGLKSWYALKNFHCLNCMNIRVLEVSLDEYIQREGPLDDNNTSGDSP